MTAAIVTKIFLVFLFSKGIVESWLDYKNKKYILKNRSAVPARFADKISLVEHQKAADYSVTKINVGNFFHLFNFALLIFWTVGGGLNIIDLWVKSFGRGEYTSTLLFIVAFGTLSFLLGLPESLYSTFVVEEKFGFNKTTAKTFIIDGLKGLLLGVVIGLPIIFGIIWIMNSLAGQWWLYAWAFLTIIQMILLWAYPTLIAPLFNKFSELEEGDVKEKVLGLLERTGFTSKGLFVMNASIRSSHGNAYFTGFGKNKRIVFFDTLIKTLDADEVEAVLAHELGHFKKKHVLKGLVKAIVFSFIGFYILGKLDGWPPFYQGHGLASASNITTLILFSMVAGVYTFFMTPFSSYISRKYEFEADEFAGQNSQAAKLITALVKLYKDNASTLTPDPVYSAFYHSHPPANIRVQFLEKLSKEK